MIQHFQIPCFVTRFCAVCKQDIPFVRAKDGRRVYDFWYDGTDFYCSELHATIGAPR